MALGHMIPTIDIAKLFAARGVKSTIVTTPHNVPFVSKAIERSKSRGFKIDIQIIKFPSLEAGLPEGCENLDSLESPEMVPTFVIATAMLQQQLEQLLQDHHPSCLVADCWE
jgi:hypothetical protein